MSYRSAWWKMFKVNMFITGVFFAFCYIASAFIKDEKKEVSA